MLGRHSRLNRYINFFFNIVGNPVNYCSIALQFILNTLLVVHTTPMHADRVILLHAHTVFDGIAKHVLQIGIY